MAQLPVFSAFEPLKIIMNLLEQATSLVAYTQQLLSQNSSLITAQSEAAFQIADLQQKIALALSQDAADKDSIKIAQDAADAAKKQADEIKAAADKASAEVVGLQQQVADMIKADAAVSTEIGSVVIPPVEVPPVVPPVVLPVETPVTPPAVPPVEVPPVVPPVVLPVETPPTPIVSPVLPDGVTPTVPPTNPIANLDPRSVLI